eukprot:COSAG01_NODE_2338_length_7873_cov_25.961538_9_plen_50_part_00
MDAWYNLEFAFDAAIIYCELERLPKLRRHCRLFASLAMRHCLCCSGAKK